jgi:hypothetical protein
MSHYNYLHSLLSWHYLDEEVCSQLDGEFKNYKIKFLNLGNHNDEFKKDKFIKIVNSKKTNLDKNIKEELIKCMDNCKTHDSSLLNENLKTNETLRVFNRIYFIADFIKERIKLADEFLTLQNSSRIRRISKSRYRINYIYYDTHENYKEQQINLINKNCYDDFIRYKKVLKKWKLQNFKEIYENNKKNIENKKIVNEVNEDNEVKKEVNED